MAKGIIINRDLVKEMAPGWEEEILAHGDVLTTGRGAFILTVEVIHETISRDGEIEFRRRT